MNPLLGRLHPYPFERLKELSAGIVPNSDYKPIGLGIGEPRHATPALIEEALVEGERMRSPLQVDRAKASALLVG
mgnify:CR=1 FL=1